MTETPPFESYSIEDLLAFFSPEETLQKHAQPDTDTTPETKQDSEDFIIANRKEKRLLPEDQKKIEFNIQDIRELETSQEHLEKLRRSLNILLSRIIEDPILREDLVSYAIFRLFDTQGKPNGWNGSGPVLSWLFTVAKNHYYEKVRGDRELTQADMETDEENESTPASEWASYSSDHLSVSDIEDEIDSRDIIKKLIAVSADEEYLIIELTMLGFNRSEIMKICGFSKARYANVLQSLRKKFMSVAHSL